jgi:tetratricopeptide (TPR) repeat protein
MSSLNDVDELLPELRLLGTTELLVRGRVVRQLGGRNGALLLARLALAPRQAHPREVLIDQIWPDADLEAGRNRLRNALSVLRAALHDAGCEDIVVADRDALRLSPGALVCDVQRFEEAVTRQQWLDARHTYAGELMPGHSDEWIEAERLRLAALADRIPSHLPVLTAPEQAAMALVDRASLLARRGTARFDERAVAELLRACELAPRFALPRVRLAATLHNRALRLVGAERRAELQRARQHIEEAARLEPNDPRVRAMAVMARYRHGLDFPQARDALQALVERFPEAAAPLVGLAMLHNDVGRSFESEDFQRRAHRMEPLSIYALYNIAVARLNGYRFGPALAMFDEVLELEPDHGVSQIGRFFALAGLGRLDEAAAQARQTAQTGAIGADELLFHDALCAHWRGDVARARTLYGDPATLALCEREPAYQVLRWMHLGEPDRALAVLLAMRDSGDPNLLVVFGSRNGLDTRADPRIDAVACSLSWRPLSKMLSAAAAEVSA